VLMTWGTEDSGL